MSPEIEAELRDYLRAQREADVKGSLDRLADLFVQHDADDKVRHSELKGDIKGLSLRVGALERSDEKLEKRVEQSGSWDREALEAEVIRARESQNWWRQQGWKWIVGALAALAMLALNVVVAWAMKGK